MRAPGCCIVLASVVGCGAARAPDHPSAPSVPRVRSNILRADYAGSDSCADCHQAIYRGWRESPMHRMTRAAATAAIRAPFDGGEFHFKGDVARLTRDGGERFVHLETERSGVSTWRITRVIGGRYREDFAGIEVTEARAGAAPVGDPLREVILPLTFVYATDSFRLKGYSVMSTERPGMRPGPVWDRTCVFCHNTAPYLWSILGALHGPGAPGYQGEVVDRLLPPERRFTFAVTDEGRLSHALLELERSLGGPLTGDRSDIHALESSAINLVRDRLTANHLLEIGIGCESCHGGCREHVDDVRVRPSLVPHSDFLVARAPDGATISRAQSINRTCARCHQVLFTRYPYTWEGGTRRKNPGGSHISSGEARDFLLGGCASKLACTACHDPHALDRRDRLEALATVAGNRVCTDCHSPYRTDEALRAHSHHDPRGAGAVCLDCHMPKKNMALGYGLSRYHRIGSPTDAARAEGDRPLECALCHADKSVAWIADAMERFWRKRPRRDALRRLYGDLDANVLVRTVAVGKPHEKAVAMEVLGEHRTREAAGLIASELVDRYPLVRHYALGALSRIAGRPCPVDLDRDDDSIRAQAAACWKALAPAAPPLRPPPAVDEKEPAGDDDVD